tara:strand:+ start:476 stop:718 length:243 start_codon:yes stop_codon:yes gene_type:complete
MTSPGNQELLEMIQTLEQKVIEQQQTINELRGKIVMIENDLDDVDNRSNGLIEKVVTKNQFNTSMAIQKKYGLDDLRGRL